MLIMLIMLIEETTTNNKKNYLIPVIRSDSSDEVDTMIGGTALILWTVLVIPVVYAFYNFMVFYMDVRRRTKHINKFPGMPPHPIWGHIHEFPNPNDVGLMTFNVLVEMFPRMAKTYLSALFPQVSLHHPETVKEILKTAEPKPWNFGAYRLGKPWWGDGLLISRGKKWSRNRRLLTPAFHFDILKPYMEVNNKSVEVFLDKIQGYVDRGEHFEVINNISLLTLDIILRCAFSYDNDCQQRGTQHPYVKAVIELGESMVYRLLRPWLYPDFIFFNLSSRGRKFAKNCDYVHSFSEEIIEKRRKALAEANAGVDAAGGEGEVANEDGKKAGRRYLDFLDILLTAKDEDKQGLTKEEIRNEADTFLFEGHDTTASAISWTLHDLAANPACQQRAFEEVKSVLGDRENVIWEDLPKLKYVAQCIKESMRLHSPVPFIERETTKDLTVDGYFLPTGTIVDINIYVLHHNPSVWPDPMKYDPERFSPANVEKQDPYAFVPFSAGPRNCIGQNFAMHEMKTCVARILQRFQLELDPNHPVKHEIIVVMKTEDGIMMKATPRNASAM